MHFQSAREIHEAYEDLERLLALRQAPAVALLLRQKFLAAVLDMGATAWSAHGFPTAIGLLSSLRSDHARHLPLDHLRGFLALLEAVQGRPAPSLPGSSTWNDEIGRAIDRLRTTLPNRETALPESNAPLASTDGRAEIAIPVVAELVDPLRTHPLFEGTRVGLLARLDVRAEFAGTQGPDDLLVIDGDVALETRAAFAQSLLIVDRFREWGTPATHRCTFRARCTPIGTRLRGRSASLGFLLAAAAARASYSLGPYQRTIPPGTAATGDLAGTRVLPVDPSTFAKKIRACLDGAIRQILVPAQQAQEARQVVEATGQSQSSGSVEIIPVSDARALWSAGSPALRRTARPWRVIAARWSDRLTRSRARMGVLGATATLLASILILWSILHAAPPVLAEWEGDRLTLRNAHRLVTKRIDLAYAPSFAHNPAVDASSTRPIADLNGDGNPDVIAIHGSVPGTSDLLSAVRGDGKNGILWTRQTDQLVPSDLEPPGDMRWRFVAVSAPVGGQVALLGLACSHHGSLSVLSRLDPVKGELLGMVRNDGHIESCSRLNFGASGRELIAFNGTLNRLQRAVALIVDPQRVKLPDGTEDSSNAPAITDAACLEAGAVAVWSFGIDCFSTSGRTSCARTYRESDGRIRVEVDVRRDALIGYIIYEFEAPDLTQPTVVGAYFTDATKDMIRAQSSPKPDAVFTAEAHRLARDAQTLTPEGWRPVRVGPRILPAAPAPVSSRSMREGL